MMGRGGDSEVSRAFPDENCAEERNYGSRGGPSDASTPWEGGRAFWA